MHRPCLTRPFRASESHCRKGFSFSLSFKPPNTSRALRIAGIRSVYQTVSESSVYLCVYLKEYLKVFARKCTKIVSIKIAFNFIKRITSLSLIRYESYPYDQYSRLHRSPSTGNPGKERAVPVNCQAAPTRSSLARSIKIRPIAIRLLLKFLSPLLNTEHYSMSLTLYESRCIKFAHLALSPTSWRLDTLV